MMKFSKDEIAFTLKALMEHKEKIERMRSYPKKNQDLKPYNILIKKLVKYRSASLKKGTKR